MNVHVMCMCYLWPENSVKLNVQWNQVNGAVLFFDNSESIRPIGRFNVRVKIDKFARFDKTKNVFPTKYHFDSHAYDHNQIVFDTNLY